MRLLMKHALAATLLGAVVFIDGSNHAHAALQDEIQVYTDEMNDPGQYGLELHVNTTPSGSATPIPAGQVPNDHGARFTPEFSLGLTSTTEAGLYVPTVYTRDGSFSGAGAKLRLKWLPVRAQDHGGFFAGVNLEVSSVGARFTDSPRSGEMRNILGWTDEKWLLAINPILGVDLSPGFSRVPSLEIATKINRRITDDFSIGWERYNDRGSINNFAPLPAQGLVNYLVVDTEIGGFDLNLGVGRGTTAASDRWTIKAIIGVPLGK
jgi:hypothetical protein